MKNRHPPKFHTWIDEFYGYDYEKRDKWSEALRGAAIACEHGEHAAQEMDAGILRVTGYDAADGLIKNCGEL